MSDDLYKILGVGKTAKPETVKRAFRKLAMRWHPDRGGDREKYERMMHAYEVLLDPERRARYDETGNASDTVDNKAALIAEVLVATLGHVLNGLRQAGCDPTKVNLIAEMRTAMESRRRELDIEKCKRQEDIRQDEALLGRFLVEGGVPNFLESSIQQQLVNRRNNLKHVVTAIEQIVAAMEYLKYYKYRADVVKGITQTATTPGMPNQMWIKVITDSFTEGGATCGTR